jgi:type II secretory pathway component PulM
MKEWWNNLSLRDKRLASLGIIVIALTLLYMLVWLPLANKNELMRTQIQHNKQLLVWMKAANQQIEALKKNKKTYKASITGASLLSIVQNSIKLSPLKNQFTQLKQSESDSIQLNFQSVQFDALVTWLIKIWQEQSINVSHISVTSLGTTGNVNAEINLEKMA